MAKKAFCNAVVDSILHYETIKIVDIQNKKLGALFRSIQAIILAYVIGYVIIHRKGYQESDTSISTVSTKLKGTAYVNLSHIPEHFNGIQIYDPADYVIPPQETDGFFVMTNFVLTPLQSQGKCPEHIEFKHNHCNNNNDCLPEMEMVNGGNGMRTGACVISNEAPSQKVCEIYGWCPTENDMLKTESLLDAAKDFTVLIKNQIHFPKFGVQRRNIIGYKKKDDLKTCLYSKDNPRCPIFKIEDIIKLSGSNFSEVAFRGAIIGIHINWDCNLDYHVDNCIPNYQFKRLDNPNAPISPGYNFRFANYYVIDGKRYRTLTKAYGIKFQVLVMGKAGRFSPVPLFLNLGAGLALLGLATVWCDFVVLKFLSNRQVYKENKFDQVDDRSRHVSTNGKVDDQLDAGKSLSPI